MIRSLSTSLMLLCAAAAAFATFADAQRPGRRRRPKVELQHLTYAEKSFKSEALDRTTKYGVYLPKDYDAEENAERKYPLIIWLHGMWENHNRFRSNGGSAALDKMVGAGDLPKCIFVTANGSRASFYINGKKSGNYEDLVAKDLIQHVNATYRVEPDRAQRALMGVSMGGFGALKIALRYPELFGTVAVHAAALLPRDPDTLTEQFPWTDNPRVEMLIGALFGKPLDKEMWARENVLCMADELEPPKLEGLKLYFDCGDEDKFGFAKPNAQLHERLDALKIRHTWRLVEGGHHGSEYTASQLPKSLKFVANSWTASRGAAGLGGLFGGGGGEEPAQPSKGKDR